MKTRYSIIVYLALTFAGSAIFYAQGFSGASVEEIALPLMWMPGLAALITQLIFHRSLAGLGWRFGPLRYVVAAMLIPIGYCLLIYVPVWLSGLGGVDLGTFAGTLIQLPILIIFSLLTALGEEIGWRGFLAPAFYRARGFAWAGLGTGIIWGLWHLPLLIGADYNAGTPAWYGVTCFMISVTGISVMMAWLRLRSASLWPAALFHSTHNAVIQGVFDQSTVPGGVTPWLTTEFGIGMAIAALVLGIYFWRRRGELPPPEATQNIATTQPAEVT